MYQNKQAFTLIELLVVVLIIGILAAAALPQYRVAVTKSHLSTLKPLVVSVARAMELYYLANGDYPTTFEELDVDVATPVSTEKVGSKLYAYYPWGNCQIEKGTSQQFIACQNDAAHIGYAQYSQSTTAYAVLHACFSTDNNEISIKVCQQETGATRSYYRGGNDGITSFAYLN